MTLSNLLTTVPRPRNRTLADAMKRIGVVERSGRGVDKIYRGLLRFGRPEPDYRRTDATSVILRLATTDADEAFLKRVVEEEGRRGSALPIDSLIPLAALRDLKRLTTEELAIHIQREPASEAHPGGIGGGWPCASPWHDARPHLYACSRRLSGGRGQGCLHAADGF
ncbi:ATP-binding protein [Duganella sp. Leaf126]|uniref:ATP-binding protein n=1 Tax=Duganella sp. Leaf126 TaxID=1736266 RepID=UPI0019101FA2|nr:ATP-binding protein [Duganella sp. Leaf126]